MWRWVFGSRNFLASPKSIRLTWLPLLPMPTRKLSGLMSRWSCVSVCIWFEISAERWRKKRNPRNRSDTPIGLQGAGRSSGWIFCCRNWRGLQVMGQEDQERIVIAFSAKPSDKRDADTTCQGFINFESKQRGKAYQMNPIQSFPKSIFAANPQVKSVWCTVCHRLSEKEGWFWRNASVRRNKWSEHQNQKA